MMKRVPIQTLIILVTASLVWISGCLSPDTPTTEDGVDNLLTREQTTDFDDPYGGLNMADEIAGFGDADILDEFDADDPDIQDEFEDDPTIRDCDRNTKCRKYLMITWGNLHRDQALAERTIWDGGLQIENGAVLLRKTIDFEDDDEILPREERDLLQWKSTTGLGLDGILVKILPLRIGTIDTTAGVIDTTLTYDEVVVNFRTEPLSVSFTLKETETFPRVIQLDDGNCVAFDVVRVCAKDCPHGFLRGVWRNVPDRPGGVFYGKWTTQNGHHMGYLKGHYGLTSAGEKRFFGKWVSRNGHFQGLVIGEYGHNEEFGGWFAGRIINRNRQPIGGLKGEWRQSDHCNGGNFRGQWGLNCTTPTL